MNKQVKVKRHTFQPGAMSIIQMGEELIGHPTTAINELVKNGYDADATECYVYVDVDEKDGVVIIFDNGLGMKSSTLFGDWLKPSVSSKRASGAKSEIFERSFLGSKGIGRLAAMALGRNLTVVTKRYDEKEYSWLSLDSEKFRSDELLSKIKFPGDSIASFEHLFAIPDYLNTREVRRNDLLLSILNHNKIKAFKEGTLIVIENIDDSIRTIFKKEFEDQNENEDDLTIRDTSIYKSLSVLVTPLVLSGTIQEELLEQKIIDKKRQIAKANNSFNVYFGTDLINELPFSNFIEVKPIPVLDKFDYRALGKVDIRGNVVGKFICKRIEELAFTEDFEISNQEVFDLEFRRLRNTVTEQELKERSWNSEAGEFYFDIRIYDRGEEDSREKLFSLIQANSTSQKKKILDGLLGLRISKNGFGVKPYGEENKDWLNLGQLRVQNPGQNVSTNQILGYIFFYKPDNDNLKEKTNREGFYENKAFIDVKYILQVIFRNIGRLRYNFRLRNNIGRIPRNNLHRPDTQSFIDFIKSESNPKTIVKRSEEFIQELTTALDNFEDTLTLSQRLASLGTGLELVYHELSQPIAKIGGSRAILTRRSEKITEKEIRETFIRELTHIGSFVAELDELKTSLRPAIGRSRPQIFKPVNTFKKVCYLFRKDFTEENIEFLTSKNADNLEIDDFEYALWISFLNIVNNAVYWLKLNKEKKTISFSIEKKDRIVIANNGPYIPDDNIDLIFEYGFTLKKEKNATGLGLAFTKNILSLNNWTIEVENRNDGPAFTIYKKKDNG
jgi:signal transduction histidine kinase